MEEIDKQDDKGLEPQQNDSDTISAEVTQIELPRTLSVRQLAELLEVSVVDIIKQLMKRSIMANINQIIDYDTAAAVIQGLGYEAHLNR